MSKKYKVASYVRLSRDDGDKSESDSIVNQKRMIKEYIKGNSDLELIKEYQDDGYSGVDFERPAFVEMMDDIKNENIDCIIVKDLSRFGRNYIESGRYIENLFPVMGIRFIAINDNYDSHGGKNEADTLIIPFKNLINDAYCKDISVKIRSQLKVKAQNGEFTGAFAPYGYLKDTCNHNQLIVDEYASEIVKSIFKWKIQGLSSQMIANKLNDMSILTPMDYKKELGSNYETGFKVGRFLSWSTVQINRILVNEVYLGTLVQGKSSTPNYKVKKRYFRDKDEWIRCNNTHEAIIPAHDFNLVQSLLQRDTRRSPLEDDVYIFSGFIECGDCKESLVRKIVPSKNKKYVYYVCSKNKKGLGCSTHNISDTKLKRIVLDAIMMRINLLVNLEQVLKEIEQLPANERNIINYDVQLVKYDEEIQRYQKIKLKLYEDLSDNILTKSEYFDFKADYTSRIEACQLSKLKLIKERDMVLGNNYSKSDCIALFKRYSSVKELDRDIIVNLVNKIIVYEGKRIELEFRHQDEIEKILKFVQMFEDKSEVVNHG